jgi:hypothetical protein
VVFSSFGYLCAKEKFLKEMFGVEFDLYCRLVPKYVPRAIPRLKGFSFGRNFPLKELGTMWGIIIGAYFLEWLKSSLHRRSIVDLFHWLASRISL